MKGRCVIEAAAAAAAAAAVQGRTIISDENALAVLAVLSAISGG